MRETKFIEQNKEKWRKFEQILRQQKKDPDQLSELFIEITNDLSFSRTFYPFRSVKVYLNNIAQRVFLNIYKNKKSSLSKLKEFWIYELPQIAYQSRLQLLISFLVFILAISIGVISSIYEPDFARIILGDSYIEMTNTNIENDDPMAVYKSMNEVDMFLGITLNNIMVAFFTFISGLIMAIGSLFVMLYNGIMVGTFQYFFIERGLFWESFLTIWLHGTLEISAIIIAGASGLVLGKGLIFTGTYSRLQSFQVSAIRGLKLFIGIAPILTFAALIESFVTRYTDLPDVAKFLIIGFSLFFILFYFVWYPHQLARSKTNFVDHGIQLPPSPEQQLKVKEKVLSNGDIFKNLFVFYRLQSKKIFLLNLGIALLYIACIYFIFFSRNSYELYIFGLMYWKIDFLFNYSELPVLLLINTLLFATSTFLSQFLLIKEIEPELHSYSSWKYRLSNFLKLFLLSGLVNLIFYLPPLLLFFAFAAILPFVYTISFCYLAENNGILEGIKSALKLFSGKFNKVITLYLLLIVLSHFLILFADSKFLNDYLDAIEINISNDFEFRSKFMMILKTFITLFSILLAYTILSIGMGIGYFSFKEINEASGLKKRIEEIGKRNKKYGIQY